METFMKVSIKSILFFVLALTTSISGCKEKGPYYFSGMTMGTTYHITVITEHTEFKKNIPMLITKSLESVNKCMSMFDRDSELSRFNRAPKNNLFCVSAPFFKVFEAGKELFQMTEGAWDGTVGPLVNLWGFGPKDKTPDIPDNGSIQKILTSVGYSLIKTMDGRCLIKTADGMELDFGSIAKGFAVDEIAELLNSHNILNYLIEIGGEVRSRGTKFGKPWKVGINTPKPEASFDQLITAIELNDRAIATSGDYRNFRLEKGKHYSHEIDPRTGYPVDNNVASVSVIADTTMFADGLATALMVMGETRGLALVNGMKNVDCLFIVRDKNKNGEFRILKSKGFPEIGKIGPDERPAQ